MRQAQESEIIRLTMDIREGKSLQLFKGNEVQIFDQKDMVDGMFTWADQIIVAKNETRRNINSRVRKMVHNVDTEEPVEGDKIICLRNAWETVTEAGDVLVNGTIGTLHNIRYNYHPFLRPKMTAHFLSEDDYEDAEMSPIDLYFRDLNIDYKLLTTGEPTVTEKNFRRFPKEFRPLTFDYGYCITCHKAQGSEYGKVLVVEEYLRGNDHARWLYTAATRAKDKLVIVRK
jgi:exodeoxyribonuclease-5